MYDDDLLYNNIIVIPIIECVLSSISITLNSA